MPACIYCIENKINNHCYIGQTKDFKLRVQKHFAELRRGTHCNQILQRAFNKYGEENFITYIIEPIENYDTIGERERYWIKEKGYYNIDKGREGFTPKALQNMSESHKGKTNGHRLIKDDKIVLKICAICEFCDTPVKPLAKLLPYSTQVISDIRKSVCYKEISDSYDQLTFPQRLQLFKEGIADFNFNFWNINSGGACPLKNRYIMFLILHTNLTYEKIGILVNMSKGGIRKLKSEVTSGIREINTTYSNFEILEILKVLLDNNTVLSTIKISESVETNQQA